MKFRLRQCFGFLLVSALLASTAAIADDDKQPYRANEKGKQRALSDCEMNLEVWKDGTLLWRRSTDELVKSGFLAKRDTPMGKINAQSVLEWLQDYPDNTLIKGKSCMGRDREELLSKWRQRAEWSPMIYQNKRGALSLSELRPKREQMIVRNFGRIDLITRAADKESEAN